MLTELPFIKKVPSSRVLWQIISKLSELYHQKKPYIFWDYKSIFFLEFVELCSISRINSTLDWPCVNKILNK